MVGGNQSPQRTPMLIRGEHAKPPQPPCPGLGIEHRTFLPSGSSANHWSTMLCLFCHLRCISWCQSISYSIFISFNSNTVCPAAFTIVCGNEEHMWEVNTAAFNSKPNCRATQTCQHTGKNAFKGHRWACYSCKPWKWTAQRLRWWVVLNFLVSPLPEILAGT